MYNSENYKKKSFSATMVHYVKRNFYLFSIQMVFLYLNHQKHQCGHFLMMNELPYKMRKSIVFMLLDVLWCGPTKPVMILSLNPLNDSMTKLEKEILVSKMVKR